MPSRSLYEIDEFPFLVRPLGCRIVIASGIHSSRIRTLAERFHILSKMARTCAVILVRP